MKVLKGVKHIVVAGFVAMFALSLQGCGEVEKPEQLFGDYEYKDVVFIEDGEVKEGKKVDKVKEGFEEKFGEGVFLSLKEDSIKTFDFMVDRGSRDELVNSKNISYQIVLRDGKKYLSVEGKQKLVSNVDFELEIIDKNTVGYALEMKGGVIFITFEK